MIIIIQKIGFTQDFGNISLIPRLCVPHVDGHLPYSNIKIGKSNTPTILKMRECSSFYSPLFCINFSILSKIVKYQQKSSKESSTKNSAKSV